MVHVYSLAIFPAVVARRTHIVGWPADVTETYFGGSGCWPSNPSVFCRQKAVFGGDGVNSLQGRKDGDQTALR